MSLVVVGSMAYDSIETPFARVDDALGGSATFFATAASHFSQVNLVAVVGTDFKHDEIAFLKAKGVDFSGLLTEQGETFRWKGRYLNDMNDRETIYTHLNVFESFKPVLPKDYRKSEYVFLANISPDLQYDVMTQVENPKFVAMDTMNFWITGSLEDLKKTLSVVDALIINDSEVRLLSGVQDIYTGARHIQEMGPRILIVKKGEHGAVMIYDSNIFSCPAFPVARLFDPTGAGDTFAGGFMGYLTKTKDTSYENLKTAIAYATSLASFSVESFSVNRLKLLNMDEIQTRVKYLSKMTQFKI